MTTTRHTLLGLAAASALLTGCGERRFYPLLSFTPDTWSERRMDLAAAALLDDGLLVVMSDQSSGWLYEVPTRNSHQPLGSDIIDHFELQDPGADCGEGDWRCQSRAYRSRVPLIQRAIQWQGEPPTRVTDLAPLPCMEEGCPQRLIGITDFSTVGALTDFRAEELPEDRARSERLFVLERQRDAWVEIQEPAVDRARQHLSDWGRATCEADLQVEGLALDPESFTLYFGLSRCQGPAQLVSSWSLADDAAGRATSMRVAHRGVRDDYGEPIAGPSEGLSGLTWAHGQLWAVSSWTDYGNEHEVAHGGRLLVADGDHLTPVELPGPLVDRPGALVIWPDDALQAPALTAAPTEPAALSPRLSALLLFDDDAAGRAASRPDATILQASIPAPADGRRVALLALGESHLGDAPVALNGLDFEWYERDHRLGQLSVVADRVDGEAGAWTSALGGLWQVRLGWLGRAARPVAGKAMGHNRQAAEVTDYSPAEELSFRGYRAVLSVVNEERTEDQPSIAALLREPTGAWEVTAALPLPADAGAGLVLQGLTIDSAPRASGGICLSAMDVGVDWADPARRDAVTLRAQLLGGLCNDFNSRISEEYHGLVTDPDAGVKVTLYFAVVEGGEAHQGSVTASQRDRPGRRLEPAGLHLLGDEPLPPRAPYKAAHAPERISNHESKGNLACLSTDGVTAAPLPRGEHWEGPEDAASEWQVAASGELPAEASAGSLSGFAFAFDLRGFEPALDVSDVSGLTARNQNVYLYRYLLRAWPERDGGLFLEGGLSHGLHLRGPGQDNAQPTALLVRSDVTWWSDLSAAPVAREAADRSSKRHDPNFQPEDGFVRWAQTAPMAAGGPACSPR